ncbi:class C sortase [Cellulomonas endometrii]|uniref:class C sortase n=1 Tax=Cellulomonas endometrii TaxID=3036301 RepID=UPI0024AE6D5D|nr:class C sortase [Cellulomonas endometrii]
MTRPRPRATAARSRRRSGGWQAVVVGVLAFAGVVVLAYPSAARWFTDRTHEREVTGYVDAVAQLPDAARRDLLADARAYNADLPRGPLRDPYTLGPTGEQQAARAESDRYDRQLRLGGESVMARLRIPAIGVDLPIRHGTSAQTLAEGLGHLFGTSLPVGGPSTHAVLTGHSGLVDATMFDDLGALEVGDRFTVDVAGETLTYEVDEILTVLPDDASALRVVEGEDRVTLVTCTPIGVNTHRLLVQGHRVTVAATEGGQGVVPGTGRTAGFPWWAVLLAAGAGGATLLAVVLHRGPRRRPRHLAPARRRSRRRARPPSAPSALARRSPRRTRAARARTRDVGPSGGRSRRAGLR